MIGFISQVTNDIFLKDATVPQRKPYGTNDSFSVCTKFLVALIWTVVSMPWMSATLVRDWWRWSSHDRSSFKPHSFCEFRFSGFFPRMDFFHCHVNLNRGVQLKGSMRIYEIKRKVILELTACNEWVWNSYPMYFTRLTIWWVRLIRKVCSTDHITTSI